MNVNKSVVVGSRYGSLIVIERINAKKNARVRCDCGSVFDTYTFNLNNGTAYRCMRCANRERKGRPLVKNRIDPLQRTINEQWNIFKKNMRDKPGSDLTKEQWFSVVGERCVYCNREPSNCRKATVEHASDFWYNGVDRIDSRLPYTNGNVQPACWICNRMKGNLSHQEFLDHIGRVVEHQDSRRNRT